MINQKNMGCDIEWQRKMSKRRGLNTIKDLCWKSAYASAASMLQYPCLL